MARDRKWTLDTIPWRDMRRERLARSDELFYMVASASFIEVTSDIYTGNLLRHFADDEEVSGWLTDAWEPEELQHGAALREYVQRVWPDFDWHAHYAAFRADYTQLCKPETLFPEHSLEMVSRCVVEMGTSCFYAALHRVTDEPVLAAITRHIYEDEVGHYKHFYRYFRRHREREHTTRSQVAGALWRRLRMIDDEDAFVSFKHVHAWRHPERAYDRAVCKESIKRCRRLVNRYFPHHMSVAMLLKPLDIPRPALRIAMPMMEGVTRLAMH